MITVPHDALTVISGSLPLSLIAKVTGVAGLGFFAMWLARRARAAVRHALLTAMFGITLLLPVVRLFAPPIRLPVPVAARMRPATAPSVDPLNTLSRASQTAIGIQPTGAVSSRVPISIGALGLLVWAFGTAVALLPMVAGLWQIRSLRRSAIPWLEGQAMAAAAAQDTGIHRRVGLYLHPDLPGPMTCGVARPDILLPAEAERWEAADLNRALVHELEHVKRGDSMTRSMARAACAIYWFHPLMWIACRRLALEAERSCDDAVLRRSDPVAYASQLVELAKRLAAERPAVLAMANRFDLKTRVRAVLDGNQPRGRAGALPLALTCGVAVALAAWISPLVVVAAPQASEAAFEVASVKPSPPIQPGDRVYFGPPRGGPGTNDPRRVTWTYAALRNMLMAAYDVQTYQIVAPDWMSNSRYDIAATVPEGATSQQVPGMWQKLLRERFGLVVHHESKEFQVRELTVGKGGAKLKPTDLGPNPDPFLPSPGPPTRNPVMSGYGAIVTIRPDGQAQMVAKALTSGDIAIRLGQALRMPVIDKTRLAGRYDFTLDFAMDLSAIQPPSPPAGGPAVAGGSAESKLAAGGVTTVTGDFSDLDSAVESQLGLKLNRTRAPLDVIVVDHAEKIPTAN